MDALPAASPDGVKFSRERQVAFLSALATCGAVRRAVRAAGVSHQSAYRARRACRQFRMGWDAALLAARAQAEDVLACRALEGVEEEVYYHGEVIATRRRHDSRLLLAHLARLDRLTGDAQVSAFAEDFDEALDRFARGEDQPPPPPENTPENAPHNAGRFSSPGQCNKWSTGSALATDGAGDDGDEGGTPALERRLAAMDAARPRGAPRPHQLVPPGYAVDEIEAEQLAAFEAGVPRWWLVIPPAEDDDPGEWRHAAA